MFLVIEPGDGHPREGNVHLSDLNKLSEEAFDKIVGYASGKVILVT